MEDDDDLDDDYDFDQMIRNHKKQGGKVIEKNKVDTKKDKKTEKENKEEEDDSGNEEDEEGEEIGEEGDESDDGNNDEEEDEEEDEDDDSDSDNDSEIDDRSISQGKPKSEEKPKTKKESGNERDVAPKRKVELCPEDLALGAAMATSKRRKRDIIDTAFNRYSFNDQNLPSWFTEDENRHNIRQMPITREEVEVYKERMKTLNARPIKKVIEAKAKKKSKMLMKLNRVRKKAQGILDATETSNKEKQDQIKGIYKKAGLLKKKDTKLKHTYVVAKKGLAGKRYKRPDGVKGTYKVVDPRMKKDQYRLKLKMVFTIDLLQNCAYYCQRVNMDREEQFFTRGGLY